MQLIRSVDDLHYAEGKEVTAERTHRLSLDGREAEIDLTAEHYAELDDLLARYFKAGRKPQDAGTRPIGRQGRNPSSFNAGMRAYADEHGIRYRTEGTGKPYYSAALVRAYTEHVAAQGGEQ